MAELLSLWLAFRFLTGPASRNRRTPLALAGGTLALDGFVLWLCLVYAPARFDTHLSVIIRQFPDVGVSLVPALGLAILLPRPRTVWLLARAWIRTEPDGARFPCLYQRLQ